MSPAAADAATVGALIAASGLPALDARALLAAVLDLPRTRLVAHPEQPIAAAAAARFAALAARRRQGEPLAYLLGTREFYGRDFAVTPDVLVPRPETELLVEQATEALREQPAARVLDLGTGSGCIAITLALAFPQASVTAVDRSVAALRVAQANAHRLGAGIALLAGDWGRPLRGVFDLIVANPPYIAAADPYLAALTHEPAAALTDGGDGLACLRAIAAEAPTLLRAGGRLLVEHGHDQGAAVRALFARAGFADVATWRDAAGIERVCGGTAVGRSARV